MILVVILYAVFAMSFAVNKAFASHSNQILFVVGTRMLFASLILLSLNLLHKKSFPKIDKSIFSISFKLGICTFLVANFLTTWALQHISPTKACLMHNLSPFITFIISCFILNEKITLRKIIGLVIGFIAMIPMMNFTVMFNNHAGQSPFLAESAALCGIVFFCYGWILLKKGFSANPSLSPIVVNGLAMLISGIISIAISLIWYEKIEVTNLYSFIYYLFGIVFLMNIVYSNLYAFLLKRYSPTFLALASFMAPLFAAFAGWIIKGEPVSENFFISSVILFLGLYIFYNEKVEIKNSFSYDDPNLRK